jgi:hypothetical protein
VQNVLRAHFISELGRDGWFGVNSLTNGEPALAPLASDLIDPYMIPGGQAAFDALVEVQLSNLST